MNTNDKQKLIIDLHNQGLSIREIENKTNIPKSTVSRIISKHIEAIKPIETIQKEIIKPILKGDEVRITSFVGLQRIAPNEYLNKDTSEVLNVTFVKATNPNQYGYFVKV